MSPRNSSKKNTGTTVNVVLDTNILYSGILFEGLESDLLDLGYQEKIRITISEYILDEITQVFQRKKLSIDLIKKYLKYSKIHVIAEKEIINNEKFNIFKKQAKEIISDSFDIPVFILAKIITEENQNSYLISGDKIFQQKKAKKNLNNQVISTKELLEKILNTKKRK